MDADTKAPHDHSRKPRGPVPGPYKIRPSDPEPPRAIVPMPACLTTVPLTLMAHKVPSEAAGPDQ
jgi:hypothetical protein